MNNKDNFEFLDLKLRCERLEEQVLQMNALQTYIMDRNKWDINAVLTMLFTIPKNAAIIRENLADPIEDGPVLDRVIAKWTKTVVVKEDRPEYKH